MPRTDDRYPSPTNFQKDWRPVMSFHEFWIGVRTNVTLNTASTSVDSLELDPSRIQVMLDKGKISLTSNSIEVFDANDFGFLEEQERQQLVNGVEHLRAIATEGPAEVGAKDQKVSKAQSDLQSIIAVLRPDKYGDPEAFRIGKETERELRGEFGEHVRNFRFETSEDANGDPAVWVWVIVNDTAAKKEVFSEIRERLQKVLRKVAPDRWPYIRFRTVSEQQAVNKLQSVDFEKEKE